MIRRKSLELGLANQRIWSGVTQAGQRHVSRWIGCNLLQSIGLQGLLLDDVPRRIIVVLLLFRR
jgi:hypothetical protein